MLHIVLVDHLPIEARINARLLEAALPDTRVYEFSLPEEARQFLKRQELLPDWVLISDEFQEQFACIHDYLSDLARPQEHRFEMLALASHEAPSLPCGMQQVPRSAVVDTMVTLATKPRLQR